MGKSLFFPTNIDIGSIVKLSSVPPFFDDVVTSLPLELKATIDAGTNH
jgi:hypothetical protein